MTVMVGGVQMLDINDISCGKSSLANPGHWVALRVTVVSVACTSVLLSANSALFVGIEALLVEQQEAMSTRRRSSAVKKKHPRVTVLTSGQYSMPGTPGSD
jgi:hypothetical protein